MLTVALIPRSDISRYEQVLKYARAKVDFGVAEKVYMLPSDMLLYIGNIKGYNNKLLVAYRSVKIGEVNEQIINISVHRRLLNKSHLTKAHNQVVVTKKTSSRESS